MDERLSRLIGRIYEAGDDGSAYQGVADEMLRLTNSRLLLLPVYSRARREVVAALHFGAVDERVEDSVRDWTAGAFLTDPTVAFITANPRASIFSTGVDMTPEEHRTDPFIQWSRHHARANHWTATFVEADGVQFGASLHARDLDEPHSERERRTFLLLFEHIVRAQRLSTPPIERAGTAEPLIALDVAGRISGANAAAERMLARGDVLSVRQGRLWPLNPRDRRALEAVLAAALHPEPACRRSGAAALARRTSGRPLAMLVEPCPGSRAPADFTHAATVRIVDPDAESRPLADRLIALWGLTPAEARLADMLAATGCDLRASAERLGVTCATARTQLARVFAKSGTGSQPELMRVMARLSG